MHNKKVFSPQVIEPAWGVYALMLGRIIHIKMKRISEEWALDWYNTRGGRTIVKPKFGERVSIKECLTPKVKDAPRKKIVPVKKKEVTLKQFIKSNYNRTYIEVGKETIILLRPLSIEGVKRLFPRVKSVYWENTKEESFSNIVKLK